MSPRRSCRPGTRAESAGRGARSAVATGRGVRAAGGRPVARAQHGAPN